jgi:hypothetical protein
MRRMTLLSLLLNMAGLVIMWAGAFALFGMLAATAWALIEFGWNLVR